MQRLHRFAAYWPTLFYVLSQFHDQVWAIVPILLYVVLFRLALLDNGTLDNAGVVLLGLLSVVFGLFLFMEGNVLIRSPHALVLYFNYLGLNFAMMPLGEVIGKHMGNASLWQVLFFVFALGLLCTLCEPAINALQALGNNVNRQRSPHLYYLVHNWVRKPKFRYHRYTFLANFLDEYNYSFQVDFWFMMVATGVGFASVVGIVRIRRRWSLKPIIFVLVPIAVTLSCIGVWALDVDLSDIIALAWDCGSIITGFVFVQPHVYLVG